MAPRKKSKAKKLTETMRQRQMRLRAEQQAAKQRGGSLAKTSQSKPASTRVEKVKVKDVTPSKSKLQIKGGSAQKALSPGAKGGAVAKTQQAKPDSPRRTKALQKQQAAAKGTKGGSRVGQPSGSANRMYGANVVNKAVKKAVRAANATKAAKVAGRAAVALGIAAEVKEMADRAKRDAERNKKLNRRPFEELRGGNRSTSKGGQGNRGRNGSTPAKRPVANLPSDYKKTEAAAFKAAKKPKTTVKSAAKAPASKPKAKPQGQSKDMGENYRRWAAANPKLAAKLKKGQAGYAELKGNKKPSTPAPASKKGSTAPSSAVKPPAKSKPKPQNFMSLSERRKKKRGY